MRINLPDQALAITRIAAGQNKQGDQDFNKGEAVIAATFIGI